jgi:hypothetical protein
LEPGFTDGWIALGWFPDDVYGRQCGHQSGQRPRLLPGDSALGATVVGWSFSQLLRS